MKNDIFLTHPMTASLRMSLHCIYILSESWETFGKFSIFDIIPLFFYHLSICWKLSMLSFVNLLCCLKSNNLLSDGIPAFAGMTSRVYIKTHPMTASHRMSQKKILLTFFLLILYLLLK
jgi:hypothetical protein